MSIAVLRLLPWWETVTAISSPIRTSMAKGVKLSGGKREEHKRSIEGKIVKEHGVVVVSNFMIRIAN
jgi:hypothetical protein